MNDPVRQPDPEAVAEAIAAHRKSTPMPRGRRPRGEPGPSGPTSEELGTQTTAVYTRAPRYVRLVVLGALLGVAYAAISTLVRTPPPNADRFTVFVYLVVICVVLGGFFGGAIALLLERFLGRRPK